jgi:hypothetical protein
MAEDFEKAIIEFDIVAAKIYSNVWRQFSEYAKQIDRENEQNVFKMQAAKFADALKQNLNEEVKKTLSFAHPKQYQQLQAALSARINYYLQEFLLRCNAQ